MVTGSGHSLGRLGEELACIFLRACGYHCLATRYRKPGGEIDLVMRRGSVVVFVEVKSRSPSGCGTPEEAVHRAQLVRLRHLARLYLHEHPVPGATVIRFDVVAVTFAGEGDGCRLCHYTSVV